MADHPIVLPEKNKRPGLCYAVADDGVELPVIDVTHPAFALDVSDAELRAARDRYARGVQVRARLPAFARAMLVRYLQKRSRLLQAGLARASTGTAGFMSGTATYLMKLGPANLGRAYALPLDRKLAASYPPLGLRLRLQDVARVLADALARSLAARSRGPVVLVNVGGGPAMDTLNALILTRKERPALLDGRSVRILVCDGDAAGPGFGARALAALRAPGGPLAGLDAALEYRPYDWAHPETLAGALAAYDTAALAAASSEGALFDYGSDQEITTNLARLHELTPPDFAVVATVIQPNPLIALAQAETRLTYHARGAAGTAPLAHAAGWEIAQVLERSTGAQTLRLVKTARPTASG